MLTLVIAGRLQEFTAWAGFQKLKPISADKYMDANGAYYFYVDSLDELLAVSCAYIIRIGEWYTHSNNFLHALNRRVIAGDFFSVGEDTNAKREIEIAN